MNIAVNPSVKRTKASPRRAGQVSAPTKPNLSAAQLNELQRRLDAIRADIESRIGAEDTAYLEALVSVKDRLEQVGRTLIHFSLEPFSWSAGVASLSLAHILENMEIGHNVIHGQFDHARHPKLNSENYEWSLVGTAKNWKRAHNYHHHRYTNIIGQDTDYGFGVFRFSEDVEWKPIHLLQPVLVPVSGLVFEYSIALYDLQLTQFLLPKKWRQENAMPLLSGPELRRELKEFLLKAGKLELKEDVLFPLLAGLLAPKVLVGNISARVIRNIWAFSVIYCGHLPDGNYTFTPEEAEAETKGQWYLRQILGSSNFEGGLLMHILSGHLSLQIEHHLFPDLPAWRYREIAPKVREICQDLDIPYQTGSLTGQLKTVARRTLQYALPPVDRLPAWAQRLAARLTGKAVTGNVEDASGAGFTATAAPVKTRGSSLQAVA